MSTITTRQQKALQTKKKILETALHLFSQKGFDSVTVDEIVNESGTSKGAFYTHFKSKYEIFLEKFKEIDDFYIDYERTVPKDIDFLETMLNFIEAQMTYLIEYLGIDIIRTIYINALNPNADNFIGDKSRSFYQVVHAFVERGKARGEVREDFSTEEMTMLFTRITRGTLYDWCLYEDNYDLIAEAKKFMLFFVEGTLKKSDPAWDHPRF